MSLDLLPTFDDEGRIVWIARPDHGVAALYAEGILVQAHETKNVALCGRITHDELREPCGDLAGESDP